MNDNNLSVYLNDHLAGATAGLEILERLCGLLKDSEFASDIEAIRNEVVDDRAELERLIDRLGLTESTMRKASGWLAEKAATLKLVVDDPRGGPLRTFESLEAISLGVEGKGMLWKTLAARAADDARIDAGQMEALRERAADHRRRLEPMRLSCAHAAFGPDGK